MDPQKPVDPSQVKLDKTSAPSAGTSTATSAATAAGSSSFKQLLIQAFFVLFVLGNVTALYILHFVNRPSPTTRFTFENFAATAGTSPEEGNAVSLSSSSSLRNGAGTTAYLSALALSESDYYYEYANFAPMGISKSSYSTNLMSYTRTDLATKDTMEGVLTTFTVGATDKKITPAAVLTENVISGESIRGIAVLSDTLAVVMSQEPYSKPTYAAWVAPVMFDGATATMAQTKRQKAAENSATYYLAPLPGLNAFVVAYYDKYLAAGYSQRVTVGMVDPSTHEITYSADTPNFAPDSAAATASTQFGKPLAISSTGAFVIPYYTTPVGGSTTVASGLCVTKAAFKSSDKSVSAFSTAVCQTQFQPANFVEAIMLSDTVFAIAFYDKANNYGLMIATVAVSTFDGSLSFRSSYALTEVSGAFEWGTGYEFYPKPSLAKLSGNRLVISFLNPSMSGRLSIKILQYSTETLAFKDVTPVLPLAPSTFNLIATKATSKAVTLDVVPISDDGVVTAYLSYRGDTMHQRFSVIEDFGTPVGILRKYTSKSKKATVAISGKAEVSVSGGLTVGTIYYATTTGQVVAASAATGGSGAYTYSSDNSLLVTTSSKIGIAVEKDQLFVNTGL